jgi:hypothetical protein
MRSANHTGFPTWAGLELPTRSAVAAVALDTLRVTWARRLRGVHVVGHVTSSVAAVDARDPGGHAACEIKGQHAPNQNDSFSSRSRSESA